MNHVVSFSGGRTSAYLVWLFEQKRKKKTLMWSMFFATQVQSILKHTNL